MGLHALLDKHAGELLKGVYERFEAALYAQQDIRFEDSHSWVALMHALHAADDRVTFERASRIARWYVNREEDLAPRYGRYRRMTAAIYGASKNESLPDIARAALKNLSRVEFIRV
ncbi:hypothetical protein HY493_05690 [Candidatus Woesearchaeota archaeon]|nr:hypothetical protein [Candidatus Woesearchaeota archaeon]